MCVCFSTTPNEQTVKGSYAQAIRKKAEGKSNILRPIFYFINALVRAACCRRHGEARRDVGCAIFLTHAGRAAVHL